MSPPVTPNPGPIDAATSAGLGTVPRGDDSVAPNVRVTRLAPSPTGALHLGNARTFLITWAIARLNGWRVILRIEDLDGPRIKPEAMTGAIRDLEWLGLDWDGEILVQSDDNTLNAGADADATSHHDRQGVVARPDFTSSHDREGVVSRPLPHGRGSFGRGSDAEGPNPYLNALMRLASRGHVFSCDLSRKDIEQAASAPHAGDHEQPYPRHLRPPREDAARWRVDRLDTNYRFAAPDAPVMVYDEFAGDSIHHPAAEVGDFVVWTKRATPAYQLAVVVDDARQGVTDVIRGDDLLPSAARQQLLYDALGLPAPRWWHLPLVLGEDGRRLAKRHGDTRVAFYRDQGVPAERVIALLARWSGVGGGSGESPASASTGRPIEAMSARDFAAAFDPGRLSHSPITFTGADHAWLLSVPSRSSWSSPPSRGS